MGAPLIPEQRMNVKGHLVTKHVKASDTNVLTADIPKPDVSDSQRQSLVSEAVSHVVETLAPFYGAFAYERYRNECFPVFSELTDRTLADISKYGQDKQHESETTNESVYGCIHALAVAKAEEKHFRHLMQMYQLLEGDFQIFEQDEMVPLCLGLDYYDKWVLDRHEVAGKLSSDDRTSYYWSLLGVTITLQQAVRQQEKEVAHGLRKPDPDPVAVVSEIRSFGTAPDVSPVIEDPDLIDLVVNNLDRVPDLIEFIQQRSETNTEALVSFINNTPHRSLGDGYL